MQSISSETKVCDACRSAYYKWKRQNPDFGDLLSRIEEEELAEADDNVDMNQNNSMDSDIIDVAKVAITSDTNSTFGITQETITLSMNCTTSSHKTCCICSANMERNSRTVSAEDRDLIFLKKNILIPEGARCCSQHLDDDRLTKNAIDKVAPFSIQSKRFSSSDVQLLISRWQILFEQQKRFDFDNPLSLSDDEYQILTSLTKVQFEDLASYLFDSNIRNSSNRSIRNALAILLCKLRLGLSLKILAVLFQLPDKKAVSRSLKTVRTALMTRFVPSNLGFNHITRQEIIDQHTSTMARRLMCDAESNTAIVVIDGIYIYIYSGNEKDFVLLNIIRHVFPLEIEEQRIPT
ncbi:unnamed protein product [Rotaria socialis]|uniref:Uncharacterized protein n=3 Tax=Rotaria socialis TaxID=392032 RepID=A0A817SP74_9BILA|nr:unnamed protein product [Rotaria socialis]